MARTTRAMAAASNNPQPQQLSSPPITPAAKTTVKRKTGSTSKKPQAETQLHTPTVARKRTREPIKEESSGAIELPHNLGTIFPTPAKENDGDEGTQSPKRVKLSVQDTPSIQNVRGNNIKTEGASDNHIKVTPSKVKKNKYGLTPGRSPWPDHEGPTAEQCYEVWRILVEKHGRKEAPKIVPQGTLDAAGCGEVPTVVEAMVRTCLSAATTGANSTNAMKGLFKEFGHVDEQKRQVFRWNEIRLAPEKRVFEAIRCGGLGKTKAGYIQGMLQQIWEENQERKIAHLDPSTEPMGAENEDESEKQQEISEADQNIISLEHVHLMSDQDAMDKFVTYPGIGPKTASCVSLFCLQRPSFAVDTHVFRMCQYLGWVPKAPTPKGQPGVNRNTTYSHCDVHVPNELKYELHQLFLEHGKKCPRCRAATGQNSVDWNKGCPLEHLVERHGAKKGGVSVVKRKKAKATARLSEDDADGDEDSVDNNGEDEEE